MNVFLGQLATLLAVALGAVGSWFASSANERTRWRRLQETRWDDKRAAAYARFAHLLKQTLRASLWVAATNGLPTRAALPSSANEAVSELARIESARSAAWEDVLLLGDGEVIQAGRNYSLEALRLERSAHDTSIDRERWSKQVQRVEEARASFHAAARKDLGVRRQDFVDEMWSWHPGPESQPDRA